MKVSHEVPLCLLEQSRAFNDYDYALVHLLDKEPDYYNFFVESLSAGRKVILDNSLYELGKAFDDRKFSGWVRKLAAHCPPNATNNLTYIIPDEFNDGPATLARAKTFLETNPKLPGRKMIVAHGKTTQELLECYTQILPLADIVGIPFGSASYLNWYPGESEDYAKTHGRRMLLDILYHLKLIQKPLHLLGCNLPQEFKYYTRAPYYSFIESLDTSSPVLHGIRGIPYLYPDGLTSRDKTKIVDLLHIPKEKVDINLIIHNVKMFRQINGLPSFDD